MSTGLCDAQTLSSLFKRKDGEGAGIIGVSVKCPHPLFHLNALLQTIFTPSLSHTAAPPLLRAMQSMNRRPKVISLRAGPLIYIFCYKSYWKSIHQVSIRVGMHQLLSSYLRRCSVSLPPNPNPGSRSQHRYVTTKLLSEREATAFSTSAGG